MRFERKKRTGRNPGSTQSRWKRLARLIVDIAGFLVAAATWLLPGVTPAQQLRPYVVTGDSITESLTGTPGAIGLDPGRNYLYVALPVGLVVLAISLITLLGQWLRRKLSAN